jgi:carbamoyl-phosphate synthase large subunit
MKELNILFLGGAKRVSLAERFISSGMERGIAVNIFSYEINDDTPISFIGKIIFGKKWSDNQILEDIEKVIIDEKIGLLLPSVDPATIVASNFKIFTKTKCFIPVPSLDLCNIFFNKQLTYNWCVANNIPVPESIINFPMIAKPINGSASMGIVKINNQEEFDEFKLRNDITKFNIQKFIDGIEYSVDIYVSLKSQKVIVSVPRIRLEVLGGEAIKSITKRNLKIIKLSEEVAIKSGITGPMVIQFIQDKHTKEFYLMEVNPRFGGAVLCSIGAGADFPGYIIDEIQDKVLLPNNNVWEDNMLMVRRFSEFYIKK